MAYNPTDISTYSGVPAAGAQYGTWIQTGLAGSSTVGDYSAPVFGPNGQQLTNPNTVIPPGSWISLGSAPSGGGNAATGTQIPIDASNIAKTNAETADIAANRASVNASNAEQARHDQASEAAQQASTQAQLQAAQLQHQDNMAQLALQTQTAETQYSSYLANYGVHVA